jgi:AAA domain-containing protein/DnaB helicase-like protein
MLKASATVVPIVQQAVGADYFYIPRNQALFTDICAYFSDQGLFDLPTLTQHLIDVGHINSVGGPGYVTELAIDFGAIPENVSYYLDILKDKYARRQIIKAGSEAAHRAQTLNEAESAADIFDDLFTGLESARSGLQSSLRLPELCDATLFVNGNCPPKPAELVKGILHQGSKLIVGGTSKGRKTMALIDLAVSVATGTPWWGFPCIKGPVCYINFEIQESFFWHRVEEVSKAKGVTLEKGMFFAWNLRGHGEGIENLTDDLMAVLRHRMFVLDIVDPIYKALGKRDENKAGDVASMLNELEKIAVKTRAAVGFGAHYSKGNQALKESIDRIGGSGVFARDPDSILTMTAHEEHEAFTVDATLRNFAPSKPFVVKRAWPLFYRDDELDPEALKQAKSVRSGQFKAQYSADMLLERLSVLDPIKTTQLRKVMDEQYGMQKSAFYRFKDKLLADGLIIDRNGELFLKPKSQQ